MYCEFPPITCIRDLAQLDPREVAIGYQHGFNGCCAPTSRHSRGYYHGWKNGCVDGGHAEESDEQRAFRLLMVLSRHEEPAWRI